VVDLEQRHRVVPVSAKRASIFSVISSPAST
jgi:hypothetical protein